MSEILEGDEWKHRKNCEAPPARAAIQAALDEDYAHKRISLEQWRHETNLLSEPIVRVRPPAALSKP